MNSITELFGISTTHTPAPDWRSIVEKRNCPYRDRLCDKNRKSEPDVLVGTCAVTYGKEGKRVIICPHRLLERRQVFSDCLQLLPQHAPGNEFHLIPEVEIPGGSVDYVLASVKRRRIMDFVGIELQTLDTTGTVWPDRQKFLGKAGLEVSRADTDSSSTFGMNWKMTAKTILVQMHHKVETFQSVNKHLVLVVQDHLLDYMQENFDFGHLNEPKADDPFHIHSYRLQSQQHGCCWSTDSPWTSRRGQG